MSSKKSREAHDRADDMKMPFRLTPRSLVVFEGLDGAGKTTQMERFERSVYAPTTGTAAFDGDPVFMHMPSGTNELGSKIYELTESSADLTPMTRQLLHLACHSTEVANTIVPALERGESVFLDRWWWSTVAYGWDGVREVMSKRKLLTLCRQIWYPIDQPDLICLFMSPHVKDKNNRPHVITGYDWLAEFYVDMGMGESVVVVPEGNEAEQSMFILDAMARRGIYKNGA